MKWAGILAVCALFLYGGYMSKAKGIRNKNPGNIRKNPSFTWEGEIGQDSDGFVIFDSPANGIRAIARTIRTYREKYGLNTIAGIIDRWAPESDGNDTNAYIKHAESVVNVPAYAPLSADDIESLVQVIIHHENGEQPYSAEVIHNNVLRGLYA